jgi:hypothetical protein
MIALLLSAVLAVPGVQGIPAQAQQAGTILGVLKDRDGNPLPGVRMAAIAPPESLIDALTSASMSSIAETDEAGRYKLENIPPGKYYIAAGRLDLQTYYPGTPDITAAKEVAVTAGSTTPGIDFALDLSSYGRAERFGLPTQITTTIPIHVTVEGGGRLPVSAKGKLTGIRFESINGTPLMAGITSTFLSIPGPTTAAYAVTVLNLPETYVVKSIKYGAIDLAANPLSLTPSNFPGATSVAGTMQSSGVDFRAGAAAAQAGLSVTAALAQLRAAPSYTPPSTVSIVLTPVAPKPNTSVGVRVTGRSKFEGPRSVFLSTIPGNYYSDGTFEVFGVPPGKHVVATRNTPGGSLPIAASLVVGTADLDGVVLDGAAIIPMSVWQVAEPRPAGDLRPGKLPLARVAGTLLEEVSGKPIPEGTVMVKVERGEPLQFPIDKNGKFELPALFPGSYDLDVEIFGHTHTRQTIDVDDKDMKLELTARRLY